MTAARHSTGSQPILKPVESISSAAAVEAAAKQAAKSQKISDRIKGYRKTPNEPELFPVKLLRTGIFFTISKLKT